MPENGKITFKVGEDTYDISPDKKDEFLLDFPDAQEMASFVVGKDTFDILPSQKQEFLADFPNAKPTFGDVKKKDQTEPIDSQDGLQGLQGGNQLPSVPKNPTQPTPLAGLGGFVPPTSQTEVGQGVLRTSENPLSGEQITTGISDFATRTPDKTEPTQLPKFEQDQRDLEELTSIHSTLKPRMNSQGVMMKDPKRYEEVGSLIDQKRQSIEAYKKELDKEVSRFVSKIDLDKYTTTDVNGMKIPDTEKLSELTQKRAKELGLPEDGYAWKYLWNKSKDHVNYQIIKPKVDEEFKKQYKELYGRDVETDRKDVVERVAGISEMQKLAVADIRSFEQEKLAEEKSKINQSIQENLGGVSAEQYLESANEAYNSTIESVNQKFAPLLSEQGFVGDENQYNQYKGEIEAAKKSYDAEIGQLLATAKEAESDATRRYNKAVEDHIASVERGLLSEIESKMKPADEFLQNRIRNAYKEAYKKVGEKDQELRSEVQKFMPNELSMQFALPIASSLGGSLKAMGTTIGSDDLQVLGDWMQSNYNMGNSEIEEWSDWFTDARLALRSTGNLIGSMTTSMVPAMIAGAVTSGAGVAPTYVALTAGSVGFFGETMDLTGRMYDKTFEETGDAGKASERAKKVFDSQMFLAPTYAIEMVPFFGNISGGLGKRLLKGAAIEYGTETIFQEYPQNVIEKAISDDANLSDVLGYVSFEDFNQTAKNTLSVALIGGGGSVMSGQSDADIERMVDRSEVEMRKNAKSLAASIKLGRISETQEQSAILSMVVNKGLNFADAVIAAAFDSGQIDYKKADQLLADAKAAQEYASKSNELGLSDNHAYVFTNLRMKLRGLKQQAESETDPQIKKIKEKAASTIESQLEEIYNGATPKYVTITLPNGNFHVLTHAEAKKKIQEEGFAETFKEGELKLEAFGDGAADINTQLEEVLGVEQAVDETPTETAPVKIDDNTEETTKSEKKSIFKRLADKLFKEKKEEATIQEDEDLFKPDPNYIEMDFTSLESIYDTKTQRLEQELRKEEEDGNEVGIRLAKEALESHKNSDTKTVAKRELEIGKSVFEMFVDDGMDLAAEAMLTDINKLEKLLGITPSKEVVDKRNELLKSVKEGKKEPSTKTAQEAPVSKSETNKTFASKFDNTEDVSDIVENGTKVKIGDTDITLVDKGEGVVEVNKVRTPEDKRGQGSARKALEEVVAKADEEGTTLELNVKPEEGTTKEGLEKLYSELGFEKTEGDMMVRKPKTQQDALQKQKAESVSPRSQAETGKEVGQEVRGKDKEVQAQKEEVDPRERAMLLAKAYTNMGKRERKKDIGTRTLAELQQIAKENGYDLRVLKSGGMEVLEDGKKIKPKFKKRSKEDKALDDKSKAKREKVLNAEPQSIENYIQQIIASGARFSKKELQRRLGSNYDIPKWMWAEEGGLTIEFMKDDMISSGLGISQDQDLTQKEIEEVERAIIKYATPNGRDAAYTDAEAIYESQQQPTQEESDQLTPQELMDIAISQGYEPTEEDITELQQLTENMSDDQLMELANRIEEQEAADMSPERILKLKQEYDGQVEGSTRKEETTKTDDRGTKEASPKELTEKELAQKEFDEARDAFKKAMAKFQAGGLAAMPEFINLVSKAAKLGIVSAKEFVKRHRDLFPSSISDQEITDAFNQVSKPKRKVPKRKKVEKAKTDLKTGKVKKSKAWVRMKNDETLGDFIEKQGGEINEESLTKAIEISRDIVSQAIEEGNVDELADKFIADPLSVHPLMKVAMAEALMDHYQSIFNDSKMLQLYDTIYGEAAQKAGQAVTAYRTNRGEVRQAVDRVVSKAQKEKQEALDEAGKEEVERIKALQAELEMTKNERDEFEAKVKELLKKKIGDVETSRKRKETVKRNLAQRVAGRKKASKKVSEKLNSLLVRTDNTANDISRVIGAAAWNAGIKALDAAQKGGKSLANAIDIAITAINEKYKGEWDQEAFRAQIESVLSEEADQIVDVETIVEKGMKDLDIKISDIVSTHWNNIQNIGKTLVDRLIEEAGLSGKEAEIMAEEIMEVYEGIIKERQMQLLEKEFGPKEDVKETPKERRKRKTQSEKILEDINKGVLTEDLFIDAFAEKYGFQSIPPNVRVKMNEFADMADKLMPYPELYNRNLAKFWDYMKENGVVKEKAYDIIMDFLYTNALGGFTTLARTQKGSLMTSTFGVVSASIASITLGNPKLVASALSNYLKGIAEGRKSFVSALKDGYSDETFRDERTEGSGYIQRKLNKGIKQIIEDKDYFGLAAVMASGPSSLMVRTYLGWDAMLKTGSKRFYAQIAEGNNYLAPELSKEMNRAEYIFSEEVEQELRKQAKEEVDELRNQGVEIPYGYESRHFDLLREQMLDDNIRERSYTRSSEGVLMSDPSGGAGVVYRTLQGLLKVKEGQGNFMTLIKGFFRSIFLINRVPAMFINQAIDYSPLGIERVLRGGTKYRDGYYKYTPEEKRTQIVKMVMGTAVALSMFAMLMKRGDDDDDESFVLDEDAPIKLNGPGYRTYSQNKLSNIEPWSIQYRKKDGTYSDPYKIIDNPLGMVLAPWAVLSDEMRLKDFQKVVKNKEYDIPERGIMYILKMTAMGATDFLTSQSYHQGFQKVQRILFPYDGDRVSPAADIALSPLKTIAISNQYRQIYSNYKAYNDIPEKFADGIIPKAIKGTPLLESVMLDDDVDVFGHPIIKPFKPPLIPDMLAYNFKENLDYREGMPDHELLIKYDGVTLSKFSAPDDIKGKEVSEEQKNLYINVAGQKMGEKARANMEYLNLISPEELQKEFSTYRSQAARVAKAAVEKELFGTTKTGTIQEEKDKKSDAKSDLEDQVLGKYLSEKGDKMIYSENDIPSSLNKFISDEMRSIYGRGGVKTSDVKSVINSVSKKQNRRILFSKDKRYQEVVKGANDVKASYVAENFKEEWQDPKKRQELLKNLNAIGIDIDGKSTEYTYSDGSKRKISFGDAVNQYIKEYE